MTNKEKIKKIALEEGLTPSELDHFMAQVKKESNFMKTPEESAFFTIKRMRQYFRKARKMTDEDLKKISPKYQGTPKKFFDTFYGDRMGNDGEGDRYRGRGAIQITGKDNYRDLGIDSDEARKKMVSDLDFSTRKSIEYFKKRVRNAENPTPDEVSKLVNPGARKKDLAKRYDYFVEMAKENTDQARDPRPLDKLDFLKHIKTRMNKKRFIPEGY